MGIVHLGIRQSKSKGIYTNKPEYDLKIRTREWENRDHLYWKQYGIDWGLLTMFNVVPIHGYFNFKRYVSCKDIAYAYLEYKDDSLTYKIYRPNASKENKWRNNNPFGVHQGYRQLPKDGELLIITKSLKDVMALYPIPSISIQAETCYIKSSVMDEYKDRFKRVIVFFDNDKQGKEQAASYKKLYKIDSIFIPEQFGVKDYSDLIKSIGFEEANKILNELIKT
jgi:hypothetical protein